MPEMIGYLKNGVTYVITPGMLIPRLTGHYISGLAVDLYHIIEIDTDNHITLRKGGHTHFEIAHRVLRKDLNL